MKSTSILSILSVVLVVTSLLTVLQIATPAPVFAAPTTRWVNNTVAVSTDVSCAKPGYTTISAAVAAASPGDTINVCTGTYTEQVTIGESLTLQEVPYPHSTSPAPTIQAPATMTADALFPNYFNIVTITGATTTAAIIGFTVTGPVSTAQVGCNTGNSGIGIFVEAGATATIHNDTIEHIREQPVVQCAAYGVGILVGRASLSTTGKATISHTNIFDYQKGGIIVDNTGSTATITGNTITGWPLAFQGANSIQIAQNGIQISRGAVATVSSNTVSSNLCPLGGTCGADLIALTQATGILLYQSGSGTSVKSNTVSGNDVGIYVYAAPSATTVTLNSASNNRYAGIAFFDGTYTASSNMVHGPGNVGIAAVADVSNTAVTLSSNTIHGNTASIGAYAGSGLTATVLFS